MTRTRCTTPFRPRGDLYAQRKRLSQRLDGFHCDVQAAYTPRCSPAPTARAESDEITPVGLQGAGARAAVKGMIEATGLNPRLSVCGWPFCLDELDDVTAEGGAA